MTEYKVKLLTFWQTSDETMVAATECLRMQKYSRTKLKKLVPERAWYDKEFEGKGHLLELAKENIKKPGELRPPGHFFL